MAPANSIAAKTESFCQSAHVLEADVVCASQNLLVNFTGFHEDKLPQKRQEIQREPVSNHEGTENVYAGGILFRSVSIKAAWTARLLNAFCA